MAPQYETKVHKETFYTIIALLLLLAGVMAYTFDSLTNKFIAPVVLSFLKLNGPPSAYIHFFTPDVSFFCFFAIICMIILHFVKDQEPIYYVVYGASFFFCFFYFFISPIEAVLVVTGFFVPVFMWHQNRINNIGLFLISFLLVLFSWHFLHKPVIFLLMLPMCHLLAIRANNALQSRYSNGQARILSKLSSTQKKKINPGHSIFKYDLWEIIGPEIDALVESWSKVQDSIGKIPTKAEEVSVKRRQVGILSSMLEIQSKEELAAAVAELQKRDPAFHNNQFIHKFREVFEKIYEACYNHEIEGI